MFKTAAETTGGWTNKQVFQILSVLKFAFDENLWYKDLQQA